LDLACGKRVTQLAGTERVRVSRLESGPIRKASHHFQLQGRV